MYESEESLIKSSESLPEPSSLLPEDKSSYWESHFQSWEQSGLTQSEYCRQHTLKYHVFLYWKRKLRKPCPSTFQSEGSPVSFVEVGSSFPRVLGLSSLSAPDDFFRLWVGGVCIEVGNRFDPESLSRLIGCLRPL